jgi:hypothetical protein
MQSCRNKSMASQANHPHTPCPQSLGPATQAGSLMAAMPEYQSSAGAEPAAAQLGQRLPLCGSDRDKVLLPGPYLLREVSTLA